MSDIVIKVQDLAKQYRLGSVGTGSFAHDLNRTWHKLRGKDDPYLMIGDTNDRSVKGSSEYVWALNNINFEVRQGDVLGIIGRNGAGKSTLLKILSRTTSPTKGSVKIKGRVASLLEVGTGFHPELSGRENIFLNGAILGMSQREIKNQFDEIVDFSGVERYIDTPVKRYSSGMYVRLAFAVAAHLDPEVLIVDEVLAVGDAEFRKKALGKMKHVSNKDGRTVLFVSHDLDAISRLTETAIYLVNGQIESMGATADVLNSYVNTTKENESIYVSKKDDSLPHIKKVQLKTTLPDNVQHHAQSMEVCISLFTPYAIKGACLSFQIVDWKERNFVHQWLFDVDVPYCREKGVYELVCHIPILKLYMGKYFIKCFFTEPPEGKVFEILENICPFEISMEGTNRSLFHWRPEACAYGEDATWTISKI